MDDFNAIHTLLSKPNGTFSVEEIKELTHMMANPETLSSMINYYRALRYNTIDWKPKSDCKILIQWGKKDNYLEFLLAKLSTENFPNGKLIVFEEGSHFLIKEYPKEVAKNLIQFFKN